jgi:hypothetical protein
MAPARVVDKNASHQSGGDGKEVGTVLPLNVLLIDEPEVCLVYQFGWLQRAIGIFPSQIRSGMAAQFRIHEGNQLLKRLLVSIAPIDEHLGDAAGG